MIILAKENKGKKKNTESNSWSDIPAGVSQGSILGPFLFNIHICGLFFETDDSDITSYANGNKHYICCDSTDMKLFKTFRIFSKYSLYGLKKTK